MVKIEFEEAKKLGNSLKEKNNRYNELKEQLKKVEEKIKEYEDKVSNLSEEITLLEAKKIKIKRKEEDGKIEDVDEEITKVQEQTKKQKEELEAQKKELDRVKGKIEDIINEVKSNPVAEACLNEMVSKEFSRVLKRQQNEKTELENKRKQLEYLKYLIKNPKKGGNYLIGIISATKSIEELNKGASESTPIEPPVLPVPEEKPKWYQFIKRFRKWNKDRREYEASLRGEKIDESSRRDTVKNREIAEKIKQEKERLEKNKAYLMKHIERKIKNKKEHEMKDKTKEESDLVVDITEKELMQLIEEICSSKDGKIKPEEMPSIIESKIKEANRTINQLDRVMKNNEKARVISESKSHEEVSKKDIFMRSLTATLWQEGGILSDIKERQRREARRMARKSKDDESLGDGR